MKHEYTITAIGLYHDQQAISRLERLTNRVLEGISTRTSCRGSRFYQLPSVTVEMFRSGEDCRDLTYKVQGKSALIEQGIKYLKSVHGIVKVERKP